MTLEEMFNQHDGEYLKFDRVENKRSQRPDLHAFLLLDELVPGKHDMISAAEHDEFFIDIEVSDLEKVINDAQVIELIRCGVMYDSGNDCLHMFA